MAVTNNGEARDARTWTNRFGTDAVSNRSAARVFKVSSTIPNESPRAVAAAAGLPNPFEAFPGDSGIFAKEAVVTQNGESDYEWLVTFNYDNELAKENNGSPPPRDPTTKPTRITSYGSERYTKLTGARRGASGASGWFTNSAGENIDPQPEIDASRSTFTFVKNVKDTDFSWGFLETFIDSINEGPGTTWGKPPRTLKVMSITAGDEITVAIDDNEPATEVTYREVTYIIQFNPDTWDIDAIDQGNYATKDPLIANSSLARKNFRQKTGEQKWYFYDDDGNPEIQNLNGSGEYLPAGSDPVVIDPKPEGYPEANFALLNLPDPYA